MQHKQTDRLVSLNKDMKLQQLRCHRDDFPDAFVQIILMNCFGENHADQLSAAGKVKIRLNCLLISCFDAVESERILENVDSSLNEDAVLVEAVPMLGVAWNPRTIAEVFIGICIDASSVRVVGARRFAHAFSCVAVLN